MSTNKLTAILITGDADSVIKAVNSFNLSSIENQTTKLAFQDVSNDLCQEDNSVEYSAYTWNFTDQEITQKQNTAAKMYLSKNPIVRFDNLMNYIGNATNVKPSNAALSNFLRKNNYERKLVKNLALGTTKVIWKKA